MYINRCALMVLAAYGPQARLMFLMDLLRLIMNGLFSFDSLIEKRAGKAKTQHQRDQHTFLYYVLVVVKLTALHKIDGHVTVCAVN